MYIPRKFNLIFIFNSMLFVFGIIILSISYLCFVCIIPGFEICGSGCEYWWSWIIDYPTINECTAMCISRNALYKPLMIIGGLISISAIILLLSAILFLIPI